MEYMNYFGFEEFLNSIIDILAFVGFFSLYILSRNSIVGTWVKYFHYAMGFMALSYFLPFSLVWLSAFVLEDMSEKYYGLVYVVSYGLPLLLSLSCMVMVYKKWLENA